MANFMDFHWIALGFTWICFFYYSTVLNPLQSLGVLAEGKVVLMTIVMPISPLKVDLPSVNPDEWVEEEEETE